jgi:branched-chain amino acid transport system substrate-binding protein
VTDRLRRHLAALLSALAAASFSLPAIAAGCADPVRFGTTISSTGPLAARTAKWRELTIEFAKMINERGGIEVRSCGRRLPVQFYIYDDQSNPETAAALYERLATTDRADFLIGPDWTPHALASFRTAEKHKIPTMMTNVDDPRLIGRGGGWLWATPMPTTGEWSTRYFDMLTKQLPPPRTIFFVAENDPEAAAHNELWAKRAAAAGLRVLASETFAGDAADFTALVLKLRLRRPDAIYIAASEDASAALISQMRRQGVRARSLHHALLTAPLVRRLGRDAEDMTGELPWYPGVHGPQADFAKALLERAGIDLFENPGTMARIAAYLIMVQAVERAGAVDREKVRLALAKGSFETPAGVVAFDETGYPARNGAMTVQVRDGRPVVVWPPEIATGRYAWPAPNWN